MEFSTNFQKWILDSLQEQKIIRPTKIQKEVFLAINSKQNIIGIAPTGTGKTLAFGLPILNEMDFSKGLQAIIVAPTRELARQIFSKISIFKKHQNKLQIRLLVGGESLERQVNSHINKAQIIVATPTRLKEIINEKSINFSEIRFLVFDEADMLMDLGFSQEIDFINQTFGNDEIRKFSFSATLHEMLSIQLKKYFTNTKIINVSNSIYQNDKIKHFVIHNADKWHSLSVIINTIEPFLCLIFANTKKEVEEIYKYLLNQNKNVTILHGDLLQRQRKNNYRDTKNNKFQYVVASDIASRGLDIDGASHVINWNLPQENEWYVHRSGRTGRGKYTGESYVLYDKKDDEKLQQLSKKGIVFNHKTVKQNKLIDKTHRFIKKTNLTDLKTTNEVKKVLVQFASSKVKPGYKKKLSEQIKKIEQKNKRNHIEKKMNSLRIKNYKIKNSKG